ncbi:MAG: hydroxypyruvate isomerase family protein [Burkholderiaceae bacterium]|jgi:hydroxypyruvate isomerase|nr:hydroxypyruvate isomerase family protein [Burkholderiaceae bacterium]
MPRFAANLSLMYTELPFLERFEAAARDGFAAVEYLFPYAWPTAELAARLKANGLQQVLFNAPPGGSEADWERGWRGTAGVPGSETVFCAGVEQALRCADALDCPRIHCMAGVQAPSAAARATYVKNLRWAAREAARDGRDILIEPINPRDMPGYLLNRQDDAHAIVQEIDAPNLKVQMDLYHCQIVEGDVASKIRQYLPTGRVGHFQIAGVPERHEPDEGELYYPYLFSVIDEVAASCGWQGWLGCEYRPRRGGRPGGTSHGLDWLRCHRAEPR